VSDVISEVVFMFPSLEPNPQAKVFRWNFYLKLNSSSSLLSLWSTF